MCKSPLDSLVPYIYVLPIEHAPDKWDVWFILKTFGTGILPASIASVAVFIAWRALKINENQKQTNAKKYDLDLFDKRYPLFEKIDDVCKELKLLNCEYEEKDYNLANENNVKMNHFTEIDKKNGNKILIFREKISSIEKIYPEIIKSTRLYQNITRDSFDFLVENIDNLREYPKNYENNFEYSVLDTYNRDNTVSFTIYLYNLSIDKFVNTQIDSNEKEIAKSIEDINNTKENRKKIKDPLLFEEFDKKQEVIKSYHEKRINDHKGYNEKLKSDIVNQRKKLDEFDDFIKQQFEYMNNIRSIIEEIHAEMDKHLDIGKNVYN